MKVMRHSTAIILILASSALSHAGSYAYIERWASGTLTTGVDFESWRIHVVVPDGDDWWGSGIDAWATGGPTWYYDPAAGMWPYPDVFDTYPDAEFGTYYSTARSYPNSNTVCARGSTADGVHEPTYLHLGGWWDDTFDTDGDYIVWQGTVLDPIPGIYGSIEFNYSTLQEYGVLTFLIPEPASVILLALGACVLLRRR